jgi:hypothetical protein
VSRTRCGASSRRAAEPGPVIRQKWMGPGSAAHHAARAARCAASGAPPCDRRFFAGLGRLVSRTRCGASSRCAAEPGPCHTAKVDGPRISSAPRRKSGALRCIRGTMATSCDRRFFAGLGRLVSRTRCGAASRRAAEPGPCRAAKVDGPRISSAPRRKSGALRCIRGTMPYVMRWEISCGFGTPRVPDAVRRRFAPRRRAGTHHTAKVDGPRISSAPRRKT